MNNLFGVLYSYLFLLIILIISTFINKRKLLSQEGNRKFIHISFANWWFIAMKCFDNYSVAIIPPISFIIFNYLSYKFKIIKAMERENNSDLGTIYYPISMLILILFSFTYLNKPFIGAIGILIMGYGDGMAALVGKKYGKYKLYKNKTIEGFITMFIMSFIVTLFISYIYLNNLLIFISLTVAIVASICELLTPNGLDNLTVPILSSILYYLLIII